VIQELTLHTVVYVIWAYVSLQKVNRSQITVWLILYILYVIN